MLIVFVLVFGLITWKLVSIQVFGNDYRKIGTASQQTIQLQGVRGSILAYNGDELALTEVRETIYANPTEITNPALEAGKLAGVLGESAFSVEAELTQKTTYVVLRSGATASLASKVMALEQAGVNIKQEPIRYYPDGTLASPLIGEVDAGGDGVGGIEQLYNADLSGRPGEIIEQVDPDNRPIAGTVTKDVAAVNGENVLTTIDPALQYQAEQALKAGIESAKAEDGVVMVMNTKTGSILAAAGMVRSGSRVVQPSLAEGELAFTRAYDPGSVGKIITISAGLAQHKITPATKLSIPNILYVAGTAFSDDNGEAAGTQLTPMGILAQSSDVGATEVGQLLGANELYRYLQRFGFTEKTDVDFPGETSGLVYPPSTWSGTSLPTYAFGDGYDVSAAQMLAAVNAVANGGVYVAPKLVTATIVNDKERLTASPAPRRVLPAWVTKEITPMLEQVVSSGTGTAAKIPGYAVAGKTGTAATYTATGVSTSVYNSGFAGYAPAEDPALTVLVVMEHTSQFGAAASAPVFQKVMKDALIDLDIPSGGDQPAPNVDAVPIVNGQPETSLLGQ